MAEKTFNFETNTKLGNARELVPLHILETMRKRGDIAYVGSDSMLAGGTLGQMLAEFPERTIDAGIAECDLIGICAGLALSGKLVFGSAFGPFLSLRSTDQIYLDLAYNDVPVCVIGTHGGVTSGGGPTHYSLMDSSIIRAMPNMIMEVPADARQSVKAADAFLALKKPMYMRLARGVEPLVYESDDYEFAIGKAITAREGSDACIIGCGAGVYNGLCAAALLEKEGVQVRVIDMHTVKPLDEAAVLQAANETGLIITVEDHGIIGGLGSAVAEVLAENGVACRFKRLGVPDEFAKLGYADVLYKYYGYDAQGIAEMLKKLLNT